MAPTFQGVIGTDILAGGDPLQALSAPITCGRRTVPPKPGMMPTSLVSGRPIFALETMTRKSVEPVWSQTAAQRRGP